MHWTTLQYIYIYIYIIYLFIFIFKKLNDLIIIQVIEGSPPDPSIGSTTLSCL
jgi:hypothetical protein